MTTPTILYGIRNCDTVKRARQWLDAQGVPFLFHDFKTAGVDAAMLHRWCDAAGWERVLNRAGTTFRKLPEADRTALDRDKAIELMRTHPTLVKRPVLEHADTILVGFTPSGYETLLR